MENLKHEIISLKVNIKNMDEKVTGHENNIKSKNLSYPEIEVVDIADTFFENIDKTVLCWKCDLCKFNFKK